MENKYEFLSKYAIDLNDRAAKGKLDPVIGATTKSAACCRS